MPKKETFIFILIIAVIILLMLFLNTTPKPEQLPIKLSELEIINYTIQGRTFQVYLADTEEKKIKGLSGMNSIDADGMLFVFDKPYKATFWNKDTHLDLELWWIRGESVIKKDYLPSIDKTSLVRIQSSAEVDKVLEIVIK